MVQEVTNFARFYALLKRMPGAHDELKDELVKTFTNGRTSSLQGITMREYNAMCNSMQTTIDGESKKSEHIVKLKQARSSVLHQLQLMGIDTTNWSAVDAYCQNSRIAGKVFRQLTLAELEALPTKLRSIYNKERKAGLKPRFTVAMMN